MIGKLKALYRVFKAGESVANPQAWKVGGAAGSALAGLIMALYALAVAFGIDLPEITETQALLWGSAIASIVYFVSGAIHIASSKKVGLPNPDAHPDPAAGAAPQRLRDDP